MTAGLILESLVAVLLVVSIGYCFILNRRLAALRNGQNEMHLVVRSLNEATEKARLGMEKLQRDSQLAVTDLTEKTRAGRAMADELGLIVESANNLADRLTGPSIRNNASIRKPEPLVGLARLDETFRRKPDRGVSAANDQSIARINTADPVAQPADKPSDIDLRAALRAIR